MGCVKKVQSALSGVEGVAKAEVAMGSAVVSGDATAEALVKAIEVAGFSAKEKPTALVLEVSGMK